MKAISFDRDRSLFGVHNYVTGVAKPSREYSVANFVSSDCYTTVSQEPQCARFSRVFTCPSIV